MGRDFVVPTGSDMTKNDWIEAMKKKPQHTGMLFPVSIFISLPFLSTLHTRNPPGPQTCR